MSDLFTVLLTLGAAAFGWWLRGNQSKFTPEMEALIKEYQSLRDRQRAKAALREMVLDPAEHPAPAPAPVVPTPAPASVPTPAVQPNPPANP
mgnify:CR=1 FL=1